MEICSDNHDEIVHTSRKCPLCEVLDLYNDQRSDIEQLEQEIEDLKYEYEKKLEQANKL